MNHIKNLLVVGLLFGLSSVVVSASTVTFDDIVFNELGIEENTIELAPGVFEIKVEGTIENPEKFKISGETGFKAPMQQYTEMKKHMYSKAVSVCKQKKEDSSAEEFNFRLMDLEAWENFADYNNEESTYTIKSEIKGTCSK